MSMSTTPHACTLLWPFLSGDDDARQEDQWLIGWNPHSLLIIVVTVVRSKAFEDAIAILDTIRGHREDDIPCRKDFPSAASLSVLGRLRASGDISSFTASNKEAYESSERWVGGEQQRSDVWIELRAGPVLDQVWCCGYCVQPCNLCVLRTDPRRMYATTPTVFSATARFGCGGVADILQGKQPLLIPGVHSTLEGVLLPPHMVPLAGPRVRRKGELSESALSWSYSRRVREDLGDSHTPMDDVASNGNSLSRREKERWDYHLSFFSELDESESFVAPPVNGLAPRLDFPTSADSTEMSLFFHYHNRGRILRKYLESYRGGVTSGGRNDDGNGDYVPKKISNDNCKNNHISKNNDGYPGGSGDGSRNTEKMKKAEADNGCVTSEEEEEEQKQQQQQKSVWERCLYASIGVALSVFTFVIPVFTFLGGISCLAAVLEFRLREIVHWLTLLQGHKQICGLHPAMPHIIHDDPAFQRFCVVNFLVRLLVDGLLGVLGSLLLAIGGEALIARSGDLWGYFLYDLHIGYMEWFEGWPAGLKMNEDLNKTLCFFAKWTLKACWDLRLDFNWVEIGYKVLVYTAPFGASCAFALISDVIAVTSMRIVLLSYAVSIPYRVMLSVMSILFLQFRGKKYNPLRRRTDAYDFEVDQMLMGTLLFTFIVFLFPTVAVYYLYFALARSSIWIVQEVLVFAAHVVLYLPVYPIIYWAMHRHEWPGGFAITSPKVTCVQHQTNAAGSSQSTSMTVETIVVSKPMKLSVVLADFVLVLNILTQLSPFRMLTVIYQAQVWKSTKPVELLIPHLQKDCVNPCIHIQQPSPSAANATSSNNQASVSATFHAATPSSATGSVISHTVPRCVSIISPIR